jgi:hypothetical protein
MRIRHRSVLAAGLLAVFLSAAGCAKAGDGTPTTPGGDVSSSASPSSGSSPSARPPSSRPPSLSPTGGVSPATGEVVVTGELQEGVESGCVLLRTNDKVYLLVGQGDRSQMQGSRSSKVIVRGKPEPSLMTTCQQGTPLRVIEMRPA